MLYKIFSIKKFIFLTADLKSHKVTGNDNIFLLGLRPSKIMCVSSQFFSEKVRVRAKTKHKSEKIHKVNSVEYYKDSTLHK